MFVIVFFLMLHSTSFSHENNIMSTTIGAESSKSGYTKKFTLPEEGLNEEEKKYLTIAMKINDVLSEETNFATIAEQVSPLLLEINDDIHNRHVFMDTEFRDELNTGKRYVSRITVKNTGNGIFEFGGLGRSITVDGMVNLMCISFSRDRPDTIMVHFYDSGNFAFLNYLDKNFLKVKREIKWSEDGKLIQERVISEPEPWIIRKGR